VTYVDANIAQKLINEMTHTKIGGRKVDLRKAELKTSDKIAILNKSSVGQGDAASQGQSLQMAAVTKGADSNPGQGGHHQNWGHKKD